MSFAEEGPFPSTLNDNGIGLLLSSTTKCFKN